MGLVTGERSVLPRSGGGGVGRWRRPSSPSVQHLSPHNISISVFCLMHRPISRPLRKPEGHMFVDAEHSMLLRRIMRRGGRPSPTTTSLTLAI